MADFWPGCDLPTPVILNAGRPGRNRPRLQSAHLPAQPAVYLGPNGQYLVPAIGIGGGHHRAASTSGNRPAQVIINNDNGNGLQWDDHSPSRRPRSHHGDRDYYHDNYERRPRSHSHSRSRSRERIRVHSRARRRTPSPYYEIDYETERKLERLQEIEEERERERREKEIKDELQRKAEREAAEKVKREREERELAKKAIEKYNAEEKEKAEKAKEAKEAANKEYREKMTKTLLLNGYTDEDIEKILNKGDGKGEGVKPAHPKPRHHEPVHHPIPHPPPGNTLSLSRPTYIKVHRKHLDTETLDTYHLPWEWDP
ncbi:MAG: hypothetical protein Q9187_007502, partial [Circinaria calcarea]